nr:unnamed protein product [Spirometra erinaceieuropaei]
MSFFYDEKDYTCTHSVSQDTPELSMISFEAREGYDVIVLNLGLRCSRRPGHMDMTVYSPYWMVNKTGLQLAYKFSRSITPFPRKSKDHDLPEIVHPADFPGVLMFSAAARSFFGESKSSYKTAASHMYNSSSDEYDNDIGQLNSRAEEMQEEEEPGSNASTRDAESLVDEHPGGTCHSCRRGRFRWKRRPKSRSSGKAAKSRSRSKTRRLAHKTSVLLRAEASAWSSSFSLDIVGSWGRVHCEDSEDKSYEIAVKIDLSSSGLTKIITFMPYFMIVNKSPIPIECAQVRDTSEGAPGTWISVPPGGAKPFWPAAVGSKKMFMICRLDSNIITSAFQLYESHTVLLRLDNKYVGLFAEVQTTDEVTVINLQLYQEGMALVKIINNLDSERPLFFFQRGTGQTHKLEAGKRTFYTWDDATKPRQFLYFFEDPGKAKPLDITTRTVLFTNNAEEANAAAKAAEMEAIDHEVTLVLQSIGVSLVNNHSCQEVCYISIRSSDIKWNRVKRENRIKPLRPEVSAELEILYNRFLDKLRVGEKCEERVTLPAHIKPPITVDLGQMVMLEPEMCSLQRTFQPGVHLQYRSSPHQMHIHAKVFRIQVDSQHLDSTFPVVFAPFQAPASMDLDSGPKPLVELIALVYRTTDKEVFRFKRLECLIQEMQCQLDQGFLNEMLDFFAGSVPEKDELTGFLVDQRSTEGELLDIPVIKDILRGGKDSIFDFLHVSPIKMHVSFSLVGSSQEGRQTAFHSDVLNLFLQSLGVALTDVQDVVFKLAYFERRACIMSMSKLTSEMTRHYAGQAIKQTYVLLLGLDVIGNPFGVIRGVAQGVEDLFYEPVKGAIIGTEEFAEGVALGVRSLVGHTVGGAAGAVSRITGTLGKGVAALTLDDDYKRRRREQLSRRPANFSAGLAQGGKDLVMGVFDGVTGIVTQPIGGAKKEGVEGFFKGMTKGLVGVFTRPISGVVDFASSSFEGIRRATSTSKEVTPVRPPRFIGLDGVIRPYDLFQAQGNVLLKPFKDTSLPEEYVFHVPLRKPKSVCILTSRRILILGFNDILGSWSCDWQINLAELDGAPTECASGLELKLLKAQRRVFGSSTASKVIEADVEQARRLQAKIVQRLSMEEVS